MNNVIFYNATDQKAQDLVYKLLNNTYKVYAITKDHEVMKKYLASDFFPSRWLTPAYADPTAELRAKFLTLDAMDQFASFEFALYKIDDKSQLSEIEVLFPIIDNYMKEQGRGIHVLICSNELRSVFPDVLATAFGSIYSILPEDLDELNIATLRAEL